MLERSSVRMHLYYRVDYRYRRQWCISLCQHRHLYRIVYVIECPHRTWHCNHSNCSNSTKTRPNMLRCCMGADQGHLQRHTSSDGPDNRVDAFACRCRILPCTGSIGPMRTRVGCHNRGVCMLAVLWHLWRRIHHHLFDQKYTFLP